MKALGIDPKEIKKVFLSHAHEDHSGGLWKILRENRDVEVLLTKSFPESFKRRVKKLGARIVEITGPTEICKGIYSTGELGSRLREQPLVIDSPKGLIVITGCSHPGIVKIAERAKEMMGRRIILLLGGFHLFGRASAEIEEIALKLKELGIIKIAPTHCSGEKARLIFKRVFGKNYIPSGVGTTIRGEEL